jgi:hypothetical protein
MVDQVGERAHRVDPKRPGKVPDGTRGHSPRFLRRLSGWAQDPPESPGGISGLGAAVDTSHS